MSKKIFCYISIFIFSSFILFGCVNYGALGLPRGLNGHIMHIVPGQTPYAYLESMYNAPSNINVFPDGSKNVQWVLDTSAGDCLVEVGLTPGGIVNWYNYTYKNAIKTRN